MYKVMLADDEGVALDALRIMITNQFHDMEDNIDIRIAQNSSQLSDIYQKYQPDILILNIQMAGLHGVFSILFTINACFWWFLIPVRQISNAKEPTSASAVI